MMEYVKAEAETISLDGIGIITASGTWPGHGWGDENHDHGGPPGQTGNKPGNGNGGSGADAEHIVGELMKEFYIRRPLSREEQQRLAAVDEAGILLGQHLQGALPAIPLTGSIALSTAYSNDAVPELVFAQQVWGHGKAGDVLLAISTSGSSKNVYYAIVAAKAKGMVVIGLTGSRQGTMDHLCDICIKAPAEETYQVQEYHLPIYHAICRYVEEKMFAGE